MVAVTSTSDNSSVLRVQQRPVHESMRMGACILMSRAGVDMCLGAPMKAN